ncbi:malonyl-CoA decarboxylase [Polynucleobacter sphagniphilus]|jgi:malonyl-CoA decarboxylase|uniref:Malonyl-CoA decarboxylase n=1 Tax=Polynucleobacter sphagniphilus TaxID=1743169 RepID=A0AA43M923_9BURK|nr:malonyl-CoA decarboxylase [Polynucleobacter sphagniphilus]MDF9788362.1 malonyl-CoA decarboxylase [Polynucleobacter sphagniphilus]MDH6154757.1 malonyl-CoA decarboxylase [Polynucleobacter sphagniphilus]MDH6241277.1 malonyl-CoA decarboxylase [Polynucleobacter sphagniphilus]MDH6248666.1 malonyl-CoA decarboxylase [Polynucleobacter sphagniphilus]MDH6300628.1 malonyl-CoA decarboxylase [Polynucleobacter sphagniphilus]
MLEKLAKARNLAKANNAIKRLISERGESNAVSMADDVVNNYRKLTRDQYVAFFTYLFEKLNPDAASVMEAAQNFVAEASARNYIRLQKVSESPRQELFRRLNRASQGTAAVVQMRRDLLQILDKKPELAAVDFDMRHLLSSWFNPGFLKMHQVDWKSPAEVLEKLIQHEAVHAIDGWDDLRRRLQPDRRCFAFFHPQLPSEPLIFVEVALLPEIPTVITPLVDKKAETLDQPSQFKVAVFYSISNCEPGLRGVSMGNFLIKRVAETLQAEFPTLKTFVTLSPIPGFMDWVAGGANLGEGVPAERLKPALKTARDQALAVLKLETQSWSERLSAGWHPDQASEKEKEALLCLASIYLGLASTGRSGNPVAKFHLGNGARLHLINWAGDLSRKGLRQSAGLMVNYLYDLSAVEENHERFSNGEIVYSKAVARLMAK